ncbi:MAG: hypothetical protein CM15mV5_0200 [uncultured marine virus]|nr:MAG: hypothetical protein CM15mV5_0200 [uncultured marine virus]
MTIEGEVVIINRSDPLDGEVQYQCILLEDIKY